MSPTVSQRETETDAPVLGFFLVLLGFAGILTWPISEVFGRNPVYTVSLTLFIVMGMIAAVDKNLVQSIIFRGLAGVFASGPLVCSAGALVDLCLAFS